MLKITQRKLLFLVPALAVLSAAPSYAIDFTANGFGSAYYGQATNGNLLPYGFTGTTPDFTDFSLIGTDVSAKFSSDWSAAAEIIASGQSAAQTNYTVFAEWAYVNWTPSQVEGLSIKFGRQRYPVWTASEYINNHFELPYRVMPQLVYQMVPFTALDGASVTETVKVGDTGMKASAQVFGGTPILGLAVNSVATFSGTKLLGGRVNLEGDGWRVRAQASRFSNQINWSTTATVPGFAPATYSTLFGSQNNANENVFTVGYRFDKYNIVSWGEYAYAYSNDGTNISGTRVLQSERAGYALIGYRLGQWMPRYTFAQNSTFAGFEAGKVTSHTFGINYQANDHVIVKAEYERDYVPNAYGGPGFIVSQPGNSVAPQTTDTSGGAFYLGADFYF